MVEVDEFNTHQDLSGTVGHVPDDPRTTYEAIGMMNMQKKDLFHSCKIKDVGKVLVDVMMPIAYAHIFPSAPQFAF